MFIMIVLIVIIIRLILMIILIILITMSIDTAVIIILRIIICINVTIMSAAIVVSQVVSMLVSITTIMTAIVMVDVIMSIRNTIIMSAIEKSFMTLMIMIDNTVPHLPDLQDCGLRVLQYQKIIGLAVARQPDILDAPPLRRIQELLRAEVLLQLSLVNVASTDIYYHTIRIAIRQHLWTVEPKQHKTWPDPTRATQKRKHSKTTDIARQQKHSSTLPRESLKNIDSYNYGRRPSLSRPATSPLSRTSTWINRQVARRMTTTWNKWSRRNRSNGYTDGSTKALRKISLSYRRNTHGPASPFFVHWHSAISKNIDTVAGVTDTKRCWN
jgi:hypothetical protein